MTDIKKINLNGTDYTLGGSSNGVTKALKKALIDIFENVAYVDGNGQQYFEALETALETKATALAVEPSSFTSYTIGSTQQLTAVTTPTDALDELTWSSSNTDVATVDDAGLVTIIGYGSAVITVSTGTLSATCSVTVSQAVVTSIDAVFNQGTAKIYDSYELTELKQYLTVTANYENGTSAVVSDYALSGTLAEGTSTITASYGGQSDTFDVLVTASNGMIYHLENVSVNNTAIDTGVTLFDTNKDFTVAFDAIINEYGSNAVFFTCFDWTNYIGLHVYKFTSALKAMIRVYNKTQTLNSPLLPDSGTAFRLRIVAYHTAGESTITAAFRIASNSKSTISATATTYSTGSSKTYIGSSTTNSGWVGDLNSFYIYNRVFTSTEINEYLGV